MIARGSAEFLEIGPGQVLTGLIRRIDKQVKVIALNDRELARTTPLTLG
jgi:[acyl-carrier-protein] S-malonyltransferase